MTTFQKVARAYRILAVLFFTTVLLGALVAGTYLALHFKTSKPPENPIQKYGFTELQSGFPGRSTNDIAALIKEAWERPLMYEPYTHFTESPGKGRFVNVSEAGFRLVEDQGPWPPDKRNINIFVFGGSTTFGYGVADDETIPSVLQRKLRTSSLRQICVYNFGRGFYYSTQERILFSNLLAAGIVPDMAVFIDGLNDFYRLQDVPQYSGSFMAVINQSFLERKGAENAKASDIVRKTSNAAGPKDEATARKICERYLRNKEVIDAMAKAHGTKTIFVWQPVPAYKFDLQYHPFAKSGGFSEHLFPGVGYRYMAQLRQSDARASGVLWLADMQENAREQLYCDAVHYTAKMCGQIAEEIVRSIREQSLIPK